MIVRSVPIKIYSTFKIAESRIPQLRAGYHLKVDQTLAGDAPKDFIRVYEYGTGRRAKSRTWPAYIAKVGHKYYPNESITEQLLTRIGETLGLNVAKSRLVRVAGQVRFCSRFFHTKIEILEHGAQILMGYLNDENFVREVERDKQEREVFTFQVVECAVQHQYPKDGEEILQEYVKMLAFDTIVGNNDRHFYNWGVIKNIGGGNARFSPIYDTARALFWNISDAKLAEVSKNPQFLDAYVKNSKPLTSWDGMKEPTHFELMREVYQKTKFKQALQRVYDTELPEKARSLMSKEFDGLLSEIKQQFVVDCLRVRMLNYGEAVGISAKC